MPKVNCPKCGFVTEFIEGDEKVQCERCAYPMTLHYKIEKIEGSPVSYLLKRAKSDLGAKKDE